MSESERAYSYLDVLLARVMPDGGSDFDGDNAQAGAALLVGQAVRDLCWKTMRYRCEKCEFGWKIWLALGVEGPEPLRASGLYVPCSFTVSCPAWPNMKPCDGLMSHINFAGDQDFAPTLPPDSVPRFVLPDSGGTCARLHIPGLALVEARRALNEPSQERNPDV